MKQAKEIIDLLYRLRLKKIIQNAALLAVEMIGAAGLILALGAVLDWIFALPVFWRDVYRWMLTAAILFWAARFLAARRTSLGWANFIREVQTRLGLAHDPLANCWDFVISGADDGRLALSFELKEREIARACALIQEHARRIKEIFGIKDFWKQWPKRSRAAFFSAPIVLGGLGLGAGDDPLFLMRRILQPYKEIQDVLKAIDFSPAPGRYRELRGHPVTLRLRLRGRRLSHWGEPQILLEGERQAMISLGGLDGESYLYSLANLQDEVALSLRWGELEAGPWIFEPVAPPSVERFEISVKPPPHAASRKETFLNPSFIEAFEGSILEGKVTADQALSQARLFSQSEGQASSETAAIAIDKKKIFSFSLKPAESARLRLALKDERGVENPQAWLFSVEMRADAQPQVTITDPIFSEVQMDAAQELAISWLAQDDVALESIFLVFQGISPVLPETSRRVWRSQASQSVAQADGSFVFRPLAWKMKAGDAAAVYFKARDNNPERREPVASRESLVIRIYDFQEEHRQNLSKNYDELKKSLMDHLARGLETSQFLSEISSATHDQANQRLASYNSEASQMTRELERYSQNLSRDPLSSPRTNWAMERLSQALGQSQSEHLASAAASLRDKELPQAKENLARYLEELEKAALAMEELRKEEKMDDAVASAARLDEMGERFERELQGSPQDLESLREAMADLDREFRQLSEALSKITPDNFPQEFVNQLPREDLPISEAAQARDQLTQALAKGDVSGALAAAKKMKESLKQLRSKLEEAAKKTGRQSQDSLGQMSSQDGEKPSLLDDLETVKKAQEKILWRTAAVERANRGDEAIRRVGDEAKEKIGEKQKNELVEIAKEQEEVAIKTKGVLKKLSEIDRSHPSLVLGPEVSKLESAWQDQRAARDSLRLPSVPPALEQESSALKKLDDVGQKLKDLSERLASPDFQAGAQPGGRQGVIFVPSGRPGGGQPWGAEQGIGLGRVPIPKPEDYRVPSENRKEILRSLEERRPKNMDEQVDEYLRNLLK
ncbi:MAG: hypothetical protein HY401_07445 [Elusimicrobia bacterium]|nr:hypothetical protein [Elusimicrobiota bacterium]